jgi:hypothetical protein
MKIPAFLKSIHSTELVLIAIFIVYLVFPISTPGFMAPYIESPLGIVVIFAVTVYLFIYSHPILAILYIFVGYELLRRSGSSLLGGNNQIMKVQQISKDAPSTTGKTAYIQHTPNESERDAEMKEMNPPQNEALEVQVIDSLAPIGKSPPASFLESSFKPVSDNLKGASFI